MRSFRQNLTGKMSHQNETMRNQSARTGTSQTNSLSKRHDETPMRLLDGKPKHEILKTKQDRETSSSKTHRKPVPLSWEEADEILRQSIEMIHQKNFNKPPNETCVKRLPSAIVIGVAKSGTRELVDFVHLHPHIQIYFTEKSYEMPYFSSKYKYGVEWLREQMPCSFFQSDNCYEKRRLFSY